MVEERTRILDLLAAGKITAEEAGRLLDALSTTAQTGKDEAPAPGETAEGAGRKTGTGSGWSRFLSASARSEDKTGSSGAGTPKFILVKVESLKGDNVNVKIPLSLVRAGLKLTSLIPQQAQDQINRTMAEKGMEFDLSSFKPEDLENLIESLREMEIDVDGANGDKVRVYAA